MRIVKFKVWDTDRPRETAGELTLEEMGLFIEGLHSITPSIKRADDKLARNGRGVRVDVREGGRVSDALYSAWHRTLHRKAYYTDIDALEYDCWPGDEITLRAMYDIKEWHVEHRKYLEENVSFKAMKKLANLANIPFYIIWVEFEQSTTHY